MKKKVFHVNSTDLRLEVFRPSCSVFLGKLKNNKLQPYILLNTGSFESTEDYILYSTQYNAFVILLRVAKNYSPNARRYIEDLVEKKGSHILRELSVYREMIRCE